MKNNNIKIVSFFRVLLVVVFSLGGVMICAQSLTNSPYSRFGIGDINRAAFPQTFGIGGSGFGLRSSSFININNPASYTSFGATVFEVGVNSLTLQLENKTQKSLSNNTSLGYIAFGIPLKKWWGMSFGILPYSTVGYNVSDTNQLANIGSVKFKYNGEGGINKIFWGTAFKYKGFSIGGNVSYLFGTINKERRVVFEDVTYAFYTKITETNHISDFAFDFGTQYKVPLKNDWSLNLGAVYALSNKVSSKRELSSVTYFPTNSYEIIRDTISSVSEKGNIVLPVSYGGGFTFEKGSQVLVSLDYSAANWSKYSAFGQSDSLKNSSQFSLGGQVTPDKSSQKYWKTVQYRAGVRYANTYLNLQGTQLNEIGISFGAGIPLRRTYQEVNTDQGRVFKYLALLNLGFEIGQRGATEKNLIKERFINARVGITINDKWFIKRKYD